MKFLIIFSRIASASALLQKREMNIRTYRSSLYQLGYFANFIRNVTTTSLMRCALACQNDDQCRLANYNSQTLNCSLIDESSFVGQIVPSSSEGSVIVFQLCLDTTQQEPAYLCFGSARPPVTVQYALNNARSVRNISMVVYVARFSSTGLLYMHQHANDMLLVYRIDTYQQIQQVQYFTGINKRNYDADFAQNYHVMTGYTTGSLYVVNPTRNVTRLSSAAYFGICLSDRYIIATRKAAGTLLDVFERSNASLAFQISVGYDYNGCAVIGDQLYLLTDTAGMKSTNIANRAGATMKNWTIGTYRPGWTNMVVDSSGRFYTACSSCGLTTTCVGYPVCAMISESSNNTLLATFGDYWYLSGRASKYAYRFFASDYNTASVLLFEY